MARSTRFPRFLIIMPSLISYFLLVAGLVDQDLQATFNARTLDDWRQVWHEERHARCRKDLLNHMRWVCQKDIYKIVKKKEVAATSEGIPKTLVEALPFVSAQQAKTLLLLRKGRLHRSKRKASSITEECCHSNGCTWEEYAEYCPDNKRLRSF